jgi:hypothetical protein
MAAARLLYRSLYLPQNGPVFLLRIILKDLDGGVPWFSVLATVEQETKSFLLLPPREVDVFEQRFGIYGGVNELPNCSSNLSEIFI